MQLNGLNKDALEQLLQNDVKSHRDLVYQINNTDKYKFLLNYIKNNDFKAFGVYRIVLGALVIAYFVATGQKLL